uniref:E3 ubiquitin-protein ligase UBR4-like n=1 Tax=Saccoglossus kowalevskii TaxID=10224 RepID=A0ABM0M5B5_SACKO
MAAAVVQDWVSFIKPLLAASYTSFKISDVPQLAQSILKSKEELLDHEDQYECFYSSFVALCSHFISTHATDIPKSSISTVMSACKVLMEFCLKRLLKYDEYCAVSQKQLMFLIEGMCKANGLLQKTDIVTFTAMMKSSKMPMSSKAATQEKPAVKHVEAPTGFPGDFFQQLTSAFTEVSPSYDNLVSTKKRSTYEELSLKSFMLDSGTFDSSIDIKTYFAARNIDNLHELGGADALLEICLNLPYLLRYVSRYKEALSGNYFIMPNNVTDAIAARNSFQSLMNDITIVSHAFSLPILEPLTLPRLNDLVTIAMSCLYAGVTVATCSTILNIAVSVGMRGVSTSKDEEMEGYAVSIVQKSLAVFNTVAGTIQNSTRTGGQNVQNFNMLGVWCILTGLQGILSLNASNIMDKSMPTKDKDSSLPKSKDVSASKSKEHAQTRPSSAKGLQGFGVLTVALSDHAVRLLTILLEDLHIEGLSKTTTSIDVSPAELNVLPNYTAWQRVQRIIDSVQLTNLLLCLVTVSYKKACTMKRQRKTVQSESGSESDSNTYYEDDFSSSQESSDDEDSEPILGHWFEETLSPESDTSTTPPPPPRPPPADDIVGDKNGLNRSCHADDVRIVPDKKEPDGFINLACDILRFLTVHLLNSNNQLVRSYLRKSFSEQHMTGLATVLKDLDKETSKHDYVKLYDDFSMALSHFNHSLLASGSLTDDLQDSLLNNLGVSPVGDGPWPLNIYPRCLAVLAHVLLLRQKRDMTKRLDTRACIWIWERFINTVKQKSLEKVQLVDFDDINVEHMQLLLFIFQNFTAKTKRNIMLRLAHALMEISDMSDLTLEPPLALSRLVMVFDYFLHHYSVPPTTLFEQVQMNVFTLHSVSPSMVTQQDNGGSTLSKQYHACKEVEDNYKQNESSDNQGLQLKPRFYNVSPAEINNTSAPKIDKEICNILFDKVFDYYEFYSAVINLLSAGSHCDVKARQESKTLPFLDVCSIQYNFIMCWRLLSDLPPSVAYMKLLESQTGVSERSLTHSEILHTIRWVPRLGNNTYSSWIKLSEFPFSVESGEILPLAQLSSLHHIYMLDSVIGKVQVALDDCFSKSMSDTNPHKAMDLAKDLLPAVATLIEIYTVFCRSSLLQEVVKHSDLKDEQCTPAALSAYGAVLRLGTGRASKISIFGMSIMAGLPAPIRSAVEKWSNTSVNEFPAVGAWRNSFANDPIPSESYVGAIQAAHLGTLS